MGWILLLPCITIGLAYSALSYEVGLIPPAGSTVNAMNKGTVKVRYNDSTPWGVICDDDFDLQDANVICRMLNFTRASQLFVESSLGVVQNISIVLDDLACIGTESSLADCQSNVFGVHDCDSSEQAGVKCTRCLVNACNGRGTCSDTASGSTVCSCNPGYTSSSCETEVNMCLPNPCTNSGTCQTSPGNFTCLCSAGWTGRLCEKDANVNRRLDIVASYNVLCSRLTSATVQQALQYLINYRYSDLESTLSGIARRSVNTNATRVCVNGILTVTWPMSRIYPADITSIPSVLLQRMISRFSDQFARACRTLELSLFSSIPIVLKPVVNSRGWVADAVLKPFCKNNLLYNAVTDSCIANAG